MLVTGTAEKIKTMEIRGAGRIARAAVAALEAHSAAFPSRDIAEYRKEMSRVADLLISTRPTAVSLPNAVHLVMRSLSTEFTSVPSAQERFSTACQSFITASENAVRRIGEVGARHIREGDVVLTHCNSEAALACLLQAHRNGVSFSVFATEVRPGNQGLLTIRVLNDAGISTSYIVDSAVRYFMKEIDRVVVGADAVSVNGAVVNKIGTSQIALAAHEARTRFLVAAETYKFAPRTILGEFIEIEERDGTEILPETIGKTLPNVTARNPVFDVTPPEYVDLIMTEEGAIPPQMAYIIIRDYLGWEIGDFQVRAGKIP
ncbi:MAG: ribose 1,5-bisphosphate isomerase [Methanoregulaceae archaeon]|nr:ribose 1,5-bisphosphate isomerase [Methanoregulaceae archaeon]